MGTTKAVGVRATYDSMPDTVQRWVDERLGSPVESAVTQEGGMSPGVAARVVTVSGARAFVKAVGSSLNPDSPLMYREELVAVAELAEVPLVPRLLASYDDGDWVALLFEDIEGRQPHHPWTPADTKVVFDGLADLSTALAPIRIPGARPLAGSELFAQSWKVLRGDPPADLDPWVRRSLDDLALLVDHASEAVRGECPTHLDIRADNTLLTPDNRVYFVDWAHTCLAVPWVDTALASLDIVISGSDVDVDGLLADHPLTRGTPDDDITALVATVTGMLVERSRMPEPPGLPTIRRYQRMASTALLTWLRPRLA